MHDPSKTLKRTCALHHRLWGLHFSYPHQSMICSLHQLPVSSTGVVQLFSPLSDLHSPPKFALPQYYSCQKPLDWFESLLLPSRSYLWPILTLVDAQTSSWPDFEFIESRLSGQPSEVATGGNSSIDRRYLSEHLYGQVYQTGKSSCSSAV